MTASDEHEPGGSSPTEEPAGRKRASGQRLSALLARILLDLEEEDEAQDAIGLAVLEVLQRKTQEPIRDLEAWLRSATWRIKKQLEGKSRAKVREEQVDEQDLHKEKTTAHLQELEKELALELLLRTRLTRRQRAVVQLYMEGKSFAMIAAEVQISPRSARKALEESGVHLHKTARSERFSEELTLLLRRLMEPVARRGKPQLDG